MNSKILLKALPFILLTLSLFTLPGCKKDNNNSPENILTSKVWKRSLTDKNPATNPSGKIIYYAVKDCEKDDTFKFGSNGKLILKRNKNKCNSNEPEEEVLNYTLNRETKRMTIDGTDYTLLEESKNQIKYCTALPSETGNEYLIFLLQ